MHIYFSGIGGVGLGPLAEISLDAGFTVDGSDAQKGSMTTLLTNRGVSVAIGQDDSHIAGIHQTNPIDWFVYTAALPADHPELVFARDHGIRISKRDELLAHIIEAKQLKLIAVAGTHGKTTTTGMLVWLFQQLGIPVSYCIGTTISFGQSGKFDPLSQYFIYECDEFDRNFLNFKPDFSLITSIDYDHPDTYPTKQSYLEAFEAFLAQSQRSLLWQHDAKTLPSLPAQAITCASSVDISSVTLAGTHNRQNGWLAVQLLDQLHCADEEMTIPLLNAFPGTHRRFEKLGDNLFSDYGHHPVEIAATLQMARELSDHVVLVYQPHQNIRQHEIKDQYVNCMKDAEMIYWLPTYLSREDPDLPILTPQELTKNLVNSERVAISDLNDELWQHIQAERKAGGLVLAMGAGSIDTWLRERVAAEPAENTSLDPQ